MTAERLKIGQPRFLSLVEILDAHEIAIARHGGAAGVRDQGSLESALAMPEQSFGGEFAHTFPFQMAAAYAFHIAKNHPFVDGNKRTAFTASTLFLWMNGWRLEAGEADAEQAVLDLVTSKLDKQGFAEWLHRHSASRPSFELRDFFMSLSGEQLLAAIKSPLHALQRGQTAEGHATVRETLETFPCVDALFDTIMSYDRVAQDAGQAELIRQDAKMLFQKYSGVIFAFSALYRIAEDMGYEW